MLQFGENTIRRIFVAWIVFWKVIFSCLNRKPGDGFLLYNIPDFLNETGHGLTDIIISCDEFKPLLHPEFFLGITVQTSTVC